MSSLATGVAIIKAVIVGQFDCWLFTAVACQHAYDYLDNSCVFETNTVQSIGSIMRAKGIRGAELACYCVIKQWWLKCNEAAC